MINVYHFSRSSKVSIDGGIASLIPSFIDAQKEHPELSVHWIITKDLSWYRIFRILRLINSRSNTLVHVHGLWFVGFFLIPFFSTPVVVSPHGMLNKHAISISYFKKWPFLFLFKHFFFGKISTVLSATDGEYSEILNSDLPIRNISLLSYPISTEKRVSTSPPWVKDVPAESKILLYLGRFHSAKNLSNLTKAWCSSFINQDISRNTYLILIGFGDHRLVLDFLPEGYFLNDLNIYIYDPVFDDVKYACLSSASISILPSFSEGLPVTILESFSCSTPAIVSPFCNLTNAVDFGAALLTNTDQSSISKSIQAFFSLDSDTILKMRRNSLSFLQAHHSYPHIASLSHQIYSNSFYYSSYVK